MRLMTAFWNLSLSVNIPSNRLLVKTTTHAIKKLRTRGESAQGGENGLNFHADRFLID